MARKTNKRKNLNFVKPLLFIAGISLLIFIFIWYKNTQNVSNNLGIDLSKVKIDEPREGNNIIYTSRDRDTGYVNYNLVNVNTGKKTKLFDSSNGVNLESIHFSPQSNYILQFNKKHLGEDVNNSNMEISINIYDMNLRNPTTIYSKTTDYYADEQLQHPSGDVISPSGNRIIIWTRDAVYENEDNPDELGNKGTLERYLIKIYMLDLSKKSTKLIAEGDLETPTVLGWVDEDQPIIQTSGISKQVGIYNMNSNNKQVSKVEADFLLNSAITDSKSLISYFSTVPVTDTENEDIIVVKNIKTDKEITRVKAERGSGYYFHPVLFSPDSKQVLLAEEIGEFKSEARNYYLLNIKDSSLELVNNPQDIVAKWNKEKYGYPWVAACMNGMNYVSVGDKIVDSQEVTQFGCGEFEAIYPKIFLSK